MSGEGRLIRRMLPFERGFTQLPNAWMRDKNLSRSARGLLAELMTHDDGWKVTIKQLATEGSEGVDAIRRMVNELEKHGYLIRRPARRGGQFTADDWEIVDPTLLSSPALIGYREAGARTARRNPTRGRTASENPTRTALDNPTTLRTPVEEIKSSKGESRGVRRDCPVSDRISPSGFHVPLDSGICVNCGADLRQAVTA